MRVSAITVGFDRKVQPAQYESAGAQVSMTLTFDADEEADIDSAITDAMDTAKSHVLVALNRKPQETKPAEKPAAISASAAANDNSTAPAVTKAAAPAKAVKKAEPAPAAEPEKPAASANISDGELMQAIARTVQRLTKAGRSGATQDILKLLSGYVPDGKPPVTHTRVPADKRALFVADLDKMEA